MSHYCAKHSQLATKLSHQPRASRVFVGAESMIAVVKTGSFFSIGTSGHICRCLSSLARILQRSRATSPSSSYSCIPEIKQILPRMMFHSPPCSILDHGTVTSSTNSLPPFPLLFYRLRHNYLFALGNSCISMPRSF